MTADTLETRVARLERQVARIMVGNADVGEPAPDAWKQSVGMFAGDPVFKEMLDEAQRIRDDARRAAREAAEPGLE